MSIQYELDFEGIERLKTVARALAEAPDELHREMERAMHESVALTHDEVRARTPIRTGTLVVSERSDVKTETNGLEGRIWTELHYAKWAEKGRGAIEAKPGHVLRFIPRFPSRESFSDGGFLYRKRVKAAAGHHMFKEGLEASRRLIGDRFGEAVKRVARKIARGSK